MESNKYRIKMISKITFFRIIYIHFNRIVSCHRCVFDWNVYISNKISFICTMFLAHHCQIIYFRYWIQWKRVQGKLDSSLEALSFLFHRSVSVSVWIVYAFYSLYSFLFKLLLFCFTNTVVFYAHNPLSIHHNHYYLLRTQNRYKQKFKHEREKNARKWITIGLM